MSKADFDYWWFLEGSEQCRGKAEFVERDMQEIAQMAFEYGIITERTSQLEKQDDLEESLETDAN